MGCSGCGKGRGRAGAWSRRTKRPAFGEHGYHTLDIINDDKLPVELRGPITGKLYLWRKCPHNSRNVDVREIKAVIETLQEKGLSDSDMKSPWIDNVKRQQAETEAKREERKRARAERAAQAQEEAVAQTEVPEVKETEIMEE